MKYLLSSDKKSYIKGPLREAHLAKNQQIKEVADLACLQIDESEIETFQNQFDEAIQFFDRLSSLDTADIKPMVTPHDMKTPLREDRVVRDLTVDELLENAPDVKDSLFRVPPVV